MTRGDDPAPTTREPDLAALGDGLGEEWVCQASDEQRVVIMPGRFMNARKGDIILSPGGNGLIGGLLRRGDLPQRYSYSGIMTRNYDAIAHSTASEERLENDPVGSDPLTGEAAATDGHRPDIVRYGWPGVVTQATVSAIHGEPMLDPETKDQPPDKQNVKRCVVGSRNCRNTSRKTGVGTVPAPPP